MGLIRRASSSTGGGRDLRAETLAAQVQERRSVRSDVLCAGTLACPACDAPVATGGAALAVTDRLCCPFCAHGAPVRDFLSLAAPTRPARVVVRVSLR